MKIIDVETIILESPYEYGINTESDDSHGPKYSCIIKVHTDEGITGVADVDSHPHVIKSIMEAPVLIPELSRGLKGILLGENPLEIKRLWQKMYTAGYYHGRRGALIQAISGVDIALWDIKSKALGVPLSIALGAKNHNKIKAYASTLFRNTPDEMKEAIEKYRQKGYTAVKFGWGKFVEDPEYGLTLLKAAREEAGEEMDILVDGYITKNDIKYAARIIRKMEELNIFWVEEPLPSDNLVGIKKLSTMVNTRIACGEQYGSKYEYINLINQGNPDVIQFDISRCGGITEALNLLFLADINDKCICPHAWTSDILTAASLHINSFSETPLFQEFCVNDSPLSRNLCINPLEIDKDGYIKVPEEPGLGVKLNDKVVDEFKIN